jgi:outer membrane protein
MVSTKVNSRHLSKTNRLAVIVIGILLVATCAYANEQPEMTPIRPDAQPAKVTENGPLEVTVIDAILLGLENNRSLRIQRLEPAIRGTFEKQEDAVFDPVITGGVSGQKTVAEQSTKEGMGLSDMKDKAITGSVGLSKVFATGTTVSLDGTTSLNDSSLYGDTFTSTRGGISITQSLLKEGGISVNLARLRQARLDTLSTEYQLRGFAEDLVARIENAYWDYALAQRRIGIYTDSLKLAEQQLAETQERITVGKTAELDLSAAEAEAASRKIGLINAHSDLDKARIQLQNLLNPGESNAFHKDLSLLDQPAMPKALLDDVSTHVAIAMRMRPDLNEARLSIRRGDLDVVKTRNGLLPRLDLFITLGSSGYADSFRTSLRKVNGDYYDSTAGLEFTYPIGNKDAQAQYQRAKLSHIQTSEILANMQQLAEVDVRSVYVEIGRAREEASATAVLVKGREETVRSETEKFRVGKSTTLLVAQTQRDLLTSQVQQIEAIVNYLKSFVNLYRSEGSLLERRGITTPGHESAPSKPLSLSSHTR